MALLFVAQTLLSVSFVSVPYIFSQTPETHFHDFSRVDKLLRDSLSRFDGGCALILIRDGKIIYDKGFGAITTDSVMPIASASKWLSGALLLTLVDEHKIALSDSIGKYLRYLSGTKATISVRQLFSHTSGFAGEIPVMRDMKLTMKNAVYAICQERLKYKPGAAFAYGGASMQIGGRIVEIVGQKSWEQLFQERIAKPLGMAHTNFYGLGVTDNPLVAGGAQSSARDYARFLHMLTNKGVWNGRRILSDAAINEMLTNQAGCVPVLKQYQQQVFDTDFTAAEKADYGVGAWRVSAESSVMILPQNLCEVSSQGRMGFTPWIDMQRGVIGVLATYTPLRQIVPTYRSLRKLLRDIVPISPTAAIAHANLNATAATVTTSSVRKR
jgi:CubicO group peptidase (beta-lactamase class C family)